MQTHKKLISCSLYVPILAIMLLLPSIFVTNVTYASTHSVPVLKAETWVVGRKNSTLVSSSQVVHLPKARPNGGACLAPGGYGTDVYRTSTYLHYDLTVFVQNGCSLATQAGKWSYTIYADCNGEFFNEGGTSGGLPSMGSGQIRKVVDQVPYETLCVYGDGSIRPPAYVEIFITASAFLTDGTLATGVATPDIG